MRLHQATLHARALLLATTLACVSTGSAAARQQAGRTITYYVAAEEIDWEYTPGGISQITGERVDSVTLVSGRRLPDNRYRKARYREYTDASFRTLKPRPPEWEHLGILGPLLRAEVGDTIRVVYRNRSSFPSSMHPHGVFYNKDSEGAPYRDGTKGEDKGDDAVPPGGTYTYVWPVRERAGPGPMDGTTVFWMYHSHSDEVRDVANGLLGPMIIAARGSTRADGSPKDVDREIITAFYVMDEEMSWINRVPELKENGARVHRVVPYSVKTSINGFTYGNLPLDAVPLRKGERVRWYVFAGSETFDFHAPHWHGNTVLIHGRREDVTSLLPMEMMIADMVPDNVGTWLFHCHVSDHLLGGMSARYRVVETAREGQPGPRPHSLAARKR